MNQPWSAGADGFATASRGLVTYGYGNAYSSTGSPADYLDTLLHRVRNVDWYPGVTTAGAPAGTVQPLAAYAYAGASMRAGVTYGPARSGVSVSDAVVQSFGDGFGTLGGSLPSGAAVGLAGLDSFGRPRDINYQSPTSGSAASLARRELAYDTSGNLIRERVTQQLAGAAAAA